MSKPTKTEKGWTRGIAPGAAVLLFLIALLAGRPAARADSPANPRADIPWQAAGEDVNAIEDAFNHARRQEEKQLDLPPGSLGEIALPRQENWDARTDQNKALFLINQARRARGGSAAGVLGLRLTGLQEHVQALAQSYAETLVARNAFTHVVDGRDPFDRIAADPVLGPCSEFLGRAENLALFATTSDSIPLYLEKAVYNWLYVDAGSAWGHRETLLLQDRDLAGDPFYGFKNNVPGSAHEGFIGVGVVHSQDGRYDPLGWGIDTTVLVVLEVIDPAPSAGCPWMAAPTPTPGPVPTPSFRVRDQLFLPLAGG